MGVSHSACACLHVSNLHLACSSDLFAFYPLSQKKKILKPPRRPRRVHEHCRQKIDALLGWLRELDVLDFALSWRCVNMSDHKYKSTVISNECVTNFHATQSIFYRDRFLLSIEERKVFDQIAKDSTINNNI